MTGGASRERLVARTPTAEEYRALCTAVGWQEVMNFAAAEAALRHGLHAVVVERDGRAIGMGRVVGDGAIYFYVQDVVVEPVHQGRGVGPRIVAALVDWVHAHAPDRAFLGVFAAPGTEGFYRRHGFERQGGLTGMFQVVRAGGADASD